MKRTIRFSLASILVALCLAFSPGITHAQDASNPRLREATSLFEEGRAAAKVRDFNKAIPLFVQALSIREQALGVAHASLAPLTNALGSAYQQTAHYADALRYYQRSLVIGEKVHGDEHPNVATLLNNLAALHQAMGQYERALMLHTRALAIYEKVLGPGHPYVATSLNNLAELHRAMGQNERALPLYTRSLVISEKVLGAEHPNVAASLNNLAALHQAMGQYERAPPLYARALAIHEKVHGPEHPNVATSLNDLAALHQAMGQYQRALSLYTRALAIREKVLGPEHPNVASSLNNLAVVHRNMGQYEYALPLYTRSLAIREKVLGPEHPNVATSLNNLAVLHRNMGQHERALPLYTRSLAIREKVLGPEHPDVVNSLNNLAALSLGQERREDGLGYLRRALPLVSVERNPETAWRTYMWLQIALAREQPSTAVVFGKQAINAIQILRQRVAQLGQEFGESFLRDKRGVYQGLADLLIEQGRLPEAQQVLAMLKEEELFEFLRRDGSADTRTTRAGFTGAEAPWVKRYASISGRVAEIGTRRQALEQKRKAGLSTEETAELKQLESDGDVARRAVVVFLDDLTSEMTKLDARRQKEVARRDVEGLENYQDDLRKLPGAVMLHYVVLPDKVRIIFTSPDTQTGRVANVSEKELNAKIADFRRVLQNPAIDPRPLARELYQWLIAPVAADLEQAKAQTIMVSLDGTLRYVPIAALHDGKGYVVERYRVTQMTEAAKNNLTSRMDNDNRLTGLGVTRAHEGFDALPSVREELDGILKHGGVKGVTHFDEAFTADSVREALTQRVPLVHVASHFKFNPGTETDSFLLLGDGKRLSLRELREAGYNFRGVDLLTLSACETAVGGGADANGREVEGFGALAQQRGARAVMASLWPVADESTAILMQNFYRLRAQGGDMNKASALRQAQLLLLQGKHALTEASAKTNRGLTSAPGERSTPDAKAPYAHPFFWAPFILMGNWL